MPDRDRVTLVGLVLEAAFGLQREFAPFAEEAIGVGGQAFGICIRLFRSVGHSMRMTDLATQTGISPSGLTRSIDRLVAEGLVRREQCESDHRGSFAVLTPLGEERMGAALLTHLSSLDEMLDGLFDSDEEARLGELLERLRNRVNPQAAFLS